MADVADTAIPANGHVIWSNRDLAAAFARCGPHGLILDLTRRGLSPFFAAGQLCRQIGLDPESLVAGLPPVLLPRSRQVEAAHIGSWIDFELFGDAPRIVADRLARAMAGRRTDQLLVLLPPDIRDVPRADGLVIAGLARAVSATRTAITFGFPDTVYSLPEDWGIACAATDRRSEADPALPAAGLPPGPDHPGIRERLALLGHPLPDPVPAPNGLGYFAPMHRFAASEPVPAAVAGFAAHWGWLGLPLVLGSASAEELAHHAWRALAALDGELAMDLARRALDRPGDTDFAQTTLATVHIINQAYDALARLAGRTTTDSLNQAWGQSLAGDAEQACAVFAKAKPQDTTAMALYLRNIAALAQFRAGDVDAAWALQTEIRDALRMSSAPFPHLVFINNLNMARLARAQNDPGTARDRLHAAFAARGAYPSEHDRLYYEVLSAGIAPDPETARLCWQRARAIFDAQDHPGAIPQRAFRSITGRLPRRFEAREHAVDEALARRTQRHGMPT